MHGLCIVVGSNIDAELAPFADYSRVERHRVYLDASDTSLMANHYGIPAGDLKGLAAKLPDWHDAEGGVDGDRLFYWSTENPQSKFDWYEVGGRFSGYLRLVHPVQATWWQRLLGRGPTDRANRARKADVDVGAILADPPAALLFGASWHECPFTDDEEQLAEWRRTFGSVFEAVPADAVLTVVDVHS